MQGVGGGGKRLPEGLGEAPRGEGMELGLRSSEEWVLGRKETICGIWGC